MNTSYTQSQLVTSLLATVGLTNAEIVAAVTGILSLTGDQTTSFNAYLTALGTGVWSNTVNAIQNLSVTDYPNFLPTIANKTALDIDYFTESLTYLSITQINELNAFMLALNPVTIAANNNLLVPVLQTDYIRRLLGLFPNSWAGDAAKQAGGNLYSLLAAAAYQLNTINTAVKATQESFYLSEATGTTLDVVVSDFFSDLPRLTNESDEAYRVRAYNSLFKGYATRPTIYVYMNSIAPTRLIEPWKPSDTGVWDGMYWDVDTAVTPGRYTDASVRYQGFADINISVATSEPNAPYSLWTGNGYDINAFGPLVNGAGQSGSTLNVKGLTPNLPISLQKNMVLLLDTGQTVEVAANVNADGSGNATVTLTTSLTSSPTDGSQIIVNPYNLISYTDESSYMVDLLLGNANIDVTVYNAILKVKALGTQIWVRLI